MKNLLADIPDEIERLEGSYADRGYSSVGELRDAYRSKQFRSALSGQFQSENPDVRKLPVLQRSLVQGMGDEIPDYPSRYFEWLRRLPLSDVENYTDKEIRGNEKYPFLTHSSQRKNILNNKARKGIFPTSVLCRPPTEFISEQSEGELSRCEIKVSNFQIMFIFHLQPRGLSAEQGFEADNYRLRLFCRNQLFRYGLIQHVNENAAGKIEENLFSGNYRQAIDSLLAATNECMRVYNFSGI